MNPFVQLLFHEHTLTSHDHKAVICNSRQTLNKLALKLGYSEQKHGQLYSFLYKEYLF